MKGTTTIALTVLAMTVIGFITIGFVQEESEHNNEFHLNSQTQLDNKYNIELSRKYGAYTKIAYCPENLIKDWSCKDCGTYSNISDLTIVQNKKTKIFGYVFYDKSQGKIIVVFRGTIDFVNEIEDLSYQQVIYNCLRCRVHLGFFQAYKSVQKETEKAVDQLLKKYPNATILNTGHSLGAALTSISAVELSKKFPNKVKEIHNFGCPRIGNEELAKNIQGKFDRLFRVVHNHDLFAHLPQQVQNFHHYPFQVLFDPKMQNYHVCDDSGQDPTCSNIYNPGYNVADHHFYFFPMNQTGCSK